VFEVFEERPHGGHPLGEAAGLTIKAVSFNVYT
jgi:hypothetical protein